MGILSHDHHELVTAEKALVHPELSYLMIPYVGGKSDRNALGLK